MSAREASGQFGLPQLKIRLAQAYPGAPALENVTPKTLYTGVLDGRIPATHLRGRWYIAETDLPLIAEMLGVVPAEPMEAPAPRAARRSTTAAASAAVPA